MCVHVCVQVSTHARMRTCTHTERKSEKVWSARCLLVYVSKGVKSRKIFISLFIFIYSFILHKYNLKISFREHFMLRTGNSCSFGERNWVGSGRNDWVGGKCTFHCFPFVPFEFFTLCTCYQFKIRNKM